MLSIITPTYNEEDSIATCIEQLSAFMESKLSGVKYEHLIIDNSSTDRTVEIIESYAREDTRVKLIVNSRNIGAPQNILRGLTFSKGTAVIPMLPADLQDPIFIIAEFYQKWIEGYKIVYGQRLRRQESFVMRMARRFYYKFISVLSHFEIAQNAGDFMLIDRMVVDAVNAYPKQDLYLRGFVSKLQLSHCFVGYTWVSRKAGQSKSTLLVLVDTALSGLINTSRLPARLAMGVGVLTSFLALFYGALTIFLVSFGLINTEPGLPTLIVLISFIGGIQLIFLGVIGEYVLGVFSHLKPDAKVESIKEINL
jgi:glycosyltransferase involved in cell wall biosynthesis